MVLRKSPSISNINTNVGVSNDNERAISNIRNDHVKYYPHYIDEKERKILRCLETRDVDLWKLREFALTKGGLVNEKNRRKAWHKLVDVNAYTIDIDLQQTNIDSLDKTDEEKDEMELIKRDVARSVIFQHNKKCSTSEKNDLADDEELKNVHIQTILSALSSSSPKKMRSTQKEMDKNKKTNHVKQETISHTVKKRPHKKLHYYQGYQDITAIILQVYNDNPPLASSILSAISSSHLRDAMRENFTTLNSVYSAITYPLLQVVDVELHDYLVNYTDVELHNAILKWVITWFAHDVHNIKIVERLFDVFLASHPLMPLYLSIAIVTHPDNRQDVFSTECDAAMIHIAIQGMISKICEDEDEEMTEDGSGITLQSLIDSAIRMMKKVLPLSLLARATRYRLNGSTSAAASTNSLKLAASAKLLRVPPSWAIASTAPPDWLQYQQQQRRLRTLVGVESKSTISIKKKVKHRKKKSSSSRNGSSTLAAASTDGGTKKELLTPDIITNVNGKRSPRAKIASGVSILMKDEDLADECPPYTQVRPSRRQPSFSFKSTNAQKYLHGSSSLVFGVFESIMNTLHSSMSMKRVEEEAQ